MSGMDASTTSLTVRRSRWLLRGQVQGVGYRPWVYRLAQARQLTGFVRNDGQGLTIEAQGPTDHLHAFAHDLQTQRPPLAQVHQIQHESIAPVPGETAFVIQTSREDLAPRVEITVDTAVCSDCLREMFDPADRRYGYALLNCTQCGPRYSIILDRPYDRARTTMAGFAMCEPCRREYESPEHRRFHAQPTACPVCGPQLTLRAADGAIIPGNPIAGAAAWLRAGKIVALKGVGGYHLALRADDAPAVARLRRLKQRDAKPLALMAEDLSTAQSLADFSAAGLAALTSPAAPIVLAPASVLAPENVKKPSPKICPDIAPGTHRLGVMLPYAPVHHLLFRELGAEVGVLVMTSANPGDEPLVTDDAEALTRLGHGGLCDALLQHDRPIARAVDDSVVLDTGDAGGGILPVRRARGYVPLSLELPAAAMSMRPGLCLGGELKNTVAVVWEGRVILSQHLGDLTHTRTFDAFVAAVRDLTKLFDVQPAWIAHDLHPDYLATQHARKLAEQWAVPCVGVQHHYAHALALRAEHALTEPMLAVVCDGTGLGIDGSIWGGELLEVDDTGFQRLAHLRPLLLPGGDAAARDTHRCALAWMHQALGEHFHQHPLVARLVPDPLERHLLVSLLHTGRHAPRSSGCGRYFDAAAALLGVCLRNTHEAQAGLVLEALAWRQPVQDDVHLYRLIPGPPTVIDLAPLLRRLLQGVERGEPLPTLAALFHDTLVQAWAEVIQEAALRTGIRTVGLTGGVMVNQRLVQGLTHRLQRSMLKPSILTHRVVPPNDGGLALGQAWAGILRRPSF